MSRTLIALIATFRRSLTPPAGEGGASLVEYALLLGLIALVCIAAVTTFGSATANSLTSSAGLL